MLFNQSNYFKYLRLVKESFMTNKTDVLIVGSGIAGLRLALALPTNIHITIFTKRQLLDTNTGWAQGSNPVGPGDT